MFLLFAFFQINDPDPVIWILIYGIMAVMCILAAFDFYLRKVIMGLGILFLLYGVYYLPSIQEWLQQDSKLALFDDVKKMEHLYVEESREFLGLMICIGVLIFHLIRSYSVIRRAA